MHKSISPKITALSFGVLVVCFVIAFYVVAWQEPSQAPPGGNVPAPLNTGPTGQSKEGGLILNTGGAPNALIIDKGKICIGADCRDSWPAAPAIGSLKPSDTLRNANDTLRHITPPLNTWVKIKETKLNADLPVCRIRFSAYGLYYNADAKIYKNGKPLSGSWQVPFDNWGTYTGDFSGFKNGDLIQIYLSGVWTAQPVSVKDFRFYYSEFITNIGSYELKFPLETTKDVAISTTNQDP